MAMKLTFTSRERVEKRPDDASDYRHRQLIGYIGLALPWLLILIVLLRDGPDVWSKLDSVSAYYYTGAVSLFSGMLVALALFLFAYDGYKNDSHWADRFCSVTGALAALGVAFFPTGAPAGITSLGWVEPWVVRIHFGSAVALFTVFAVFSLYLFCKKAEAPGREQADRGKKWRNVIYRTCGLVIVACILWAGYNGFTNRFIFWPEAIALTAFAISWLVKGYALRSIMNLARSLIPNATFDDEEEMSRKGH